MDRRKECYVSLDVETDGPMPFLNSMRSLGAAVIGWNDLEEKWELSHTFSVNLEPYPGATEDHETMHFWARNPVAWAQCNANKQPIEESMIRFSAWLQQARTYWDRRPVAVGAPAGFDFPFVRGYMIKYLGHDRPFGHSCLDTKSVAATILKLSYSDAGKRNYPDQWFRDKFDHTHVAVEDAIEQAWIWARMVETI